MLLTALPFPSHADRNCQISFIDVAQPKYKGSFCSGTKQKQQIAQVASVLTAAELQGKISPETFRCVLLKLVSFPSFGGSFTGWKRRTHTQSDCRRSCFSALPLEESYRSVGYGPGPMLLTDHLQPHYSWKDCEWITRFCAYPYSLLMR